MVPSKANNDFLIAEAHAKINLHLEVLGIRSDGFHELAMVMQSINLSDQLKMINSSDHNINLKSNNNEISNGEDNLIIKAAKLLRNKVRNNELGVDIVLEKNIPIGAGLAGGSTDAAATLVGLNKLWKLNLKTEELEDLSKEIGSDIKDFKVGDAVMTFVFFNGYSSHINIDANLAMKLPEHFSLSDGGAFPLVYMTAYMMMFDLGNLQKDEIFFIQGAGGGVGTAAIQLAKSVGAKIIGTSSKWKHQKLYDQEYTFQLLLNY